MGHCQAMIPARPLAATINLTVKWPLDFSIDGGVCLPIPHLLHSMLSPQSLPPHPTLKQQLQISPQRPERSSSPSPPEGATWCCHLLDDSEKDV